MTSPARFVGADPTGASRGRGVGARAVPLARHLPTALTLVAVPLVRPNVWGESLALLGFLLLVVAAAVALILRPGAGETAPRWATTRPTVDLATVSVALLALAYLYVLVWQAVFAPADETQNTLQGIVIMCGALVALLVVLSDPETRVAVARGFVVIIVVLCASYAVTALIWVVAGLGTGQIGTLSIGKWGPQPLYFPFTTTVGFQPVFGLDVPRFTGIGREPGWMAMYCAATFFLAEMVGIRSRLVKALLLLGLLGAVSTAGFGVFVVVWAYHRFLRDRGGITMANYLRQIFGLAAIAGAGWLAVFAPVLGLSAKSAQNATSLDQRQSATMTGLRALTESPWGGPPSGISGGINLVSDIAVSGLPFVLLVVLALLVATSRIGSAKSGTAVVLAVLFTLLLSQPAKDSTWAFAVVAMSCSLRRPDTPERAAPVEPGAGPDPPGRVETSEKPTTRPRPRAGRSRKQP